MLFDRNRAFEFGANGDLDPAGRAADAIMGEYREDQTDLASRFSLWRLTL